MSHNSISEAPGSVPLTISLFCRFDHCHKYYNVIILKFYYSSAKNPLLCCQWALGNIDKLCLLLQSITYNMENYIEYWCSIMSFTLLGQVVPICLHEMYAAVADRQFFATNYHCFLHTVSSMVIIHSLTLPTVRYSTPVVGALHHDLMLLSPTVAHNLQCRLPITAEHPLPLLGHSSVVVLLHLSSPCLTICRGQLQFSLRHPMSWTVNEQALFLVKHIPAQVTLLLNSIMWPSLCVYLTLVKGFTHIVCYVFSVHYQEMKQGPSYCRQAGMTRITIHYDMSWKTSCLFYMDLAQMATLLSISW